MRRGAFANGLSVALLCLLSVAPGLGQENPIAEAQTHQHQGTEANRAGDYGDFARSMERALELNPANFATQYNRACDYARTGRADEALDLLEAQTLAKVDFGMARGPDLESLRELARFQELVVLLEASIVPINNSEHRMTIEQVGLIPEGIAIDRKTGRL